LLKERPFLYFNSAEKKSHLLMGYGLMCHMAQDLENQQDVAMYGVNTQKPMF